MNEPMQALVGREKKCPVCKKEFIAHEDWVFRRKQGFKEKVFCSWGCMRKWERGRQKPIERREKIVKAIMDGLNDREIAFMLDEDTTSISYWRKKLIQEDKKHERKTEPESGE